MNSLYLFVYGSLKLGECNDHMLRHWVVSSVPAWTPGQMRLRPDHYPALFLKGHGRIGTSDYRKDLTLDRAAVCQSEGKVNGELLQLSDGEAALSQLDVFEGFFPHGESEYLRVALTVQTDGGPRVCWTYTGVGEPPSDWLEIEEWPPPNGVRKPDPYNYG